MTNQSSFNRAITLSLLFIFMFTFACRSSTDPDPEPEPEEIIGEQELAIEVASSDREPLTGYNIDIDGPTSASSDNVSESTFVLTDLASGEYSVTVEKDGFITGQIAFTLDVPEDISDSFFATRSIFIREKTPPVTINNNEDTSVATAPSEDPDGEGATIFDIPAGSFPDEVLDEDGNVSMSVTRMRTNQITQTDDEIVLDEFAFDPSGFELNNPISMSFFVAIDTDFFEGASYALQPGNIPLTVVDDPAAIQSASKIYGHQNHQNVGSLFLTAPRSATVVSPLTTLVMIKSQIDAGGGGASGFSMDFTDETSFNVVQSLTSECGAPNTLSFTEDIGPAADQTEERNLFSRFTTDIPEFVANKSYSKTETARQDRRIQQTAEIKSRTLTVTTFRGQTQVNSSTLTFNMDEVKFGAELLPCHDSGGN